MKKAKIDWSSKKMRGASASEIPAHLLGLQSKTKALRAASAEWFEEALLDDDDHYPAVAADVVSALLAMLHENEVPDQALVTTLVTDLAVFNYPYHVVTGVQADKFSGALKKSYTQFCKSKPFFIELLANKKAPTRAAAAFALAFIVDDTAATLQLLDNHLKIEKDTNVIISCILAVGICARHENVSQPKGFTRFIENNDHVLRAAAAISLTVAGKKVSPEIYSELVSCLIAPKTSAPWFGGNLSFYVDNIFTQDPKKHKLALPALKKLLSSPSTLKHDDNIKLIIANVTISLGFFEFAGRAEDPVTHDELSEEQIELLTLLKELGARTSRLEDHGLPGQDALQLLISPQTGPLDHLVKILVKGKEQTLPFWKCLHMQFNRKISSAELVNIITKQVPRKDVFDLLKEASEYKNDVPVIAGQVVMDCLHWLGKDALAPGKKLCDQLAKTEEYYSSPLATLALNALLINGETHFPDKYGAVVAELSRTSKAIGLKQALKCLSLEAQKKYNLLSK